MLEIAIWRLSDDLGEGEQGLPLDVAPDLEDGGGELVHLHHGGRLHRGSHLSLQIIRQALWKLGNVLFIFE